MATKYYVVWKGRETGVFEDWQTCKRQIDQFPSARYKSFKTREEAEQAFSGGASLASSKTFKKPPGVKTYNQTEVLAIQADVKIFTDGGCEPNPGEAGSGLAVYEGGQLAQLWYGLYNPNGTNNTAELNALHHALMLAKATLAQGKSVVIFCDSKYAIQCITQWAFGWEKKGWKKAGGEIKNLALIQAMFTLYKSLANAAPVLHVNGHVGVEGNELADRMSILAIKEKQVAFLPYEGDLDIPQILAMKAG